MSPTGVKVGERAFRVEIGFIVGDRGRAFGDRGVVREVALGDASLEAARFGEVGWRIIGRDDAEVAVEAEGPATAPEPRTGMRDDELLADVVEGFEGENIEASPPANPTDPKESRNEIPIGSVISARFFALFSNSAGLPPYSK